MPLATILAPRATRHYLPRPSPAGYCLPPTAQLPKTERARSRRAGPLFQYVTEPGDFYGQNNSFLSNRRHSPVDRSLVAKVPNVSGFRRACPMAVSRNVVLSLISRNSPKQLSMVSLELCRLRRQVLRGFLLHRTFENEGCFPEQRLATIELTFLPSPGTASVPSDAEVR